MPLQVLLPADQAERHAAGCEPGQAPAAPAVLVVKRRCCEGGRAVRCSQLLKQRGCWGRLRVPAFVQATSPRATAGGVNVPCWPGHHHACRAHTKAAHRNSVYGGMHQDHMLMYQGGVHRSPNLLQIQFNSSSSEPAHHDEVCGWCCGHRDCDAHCQCCVDAGEGGCAPHHRQEKAHLQLAAHMPSPCLLPCTTWCGMQCS